ncbi:hypothetical protein CLV92_106225 [Kineococcus xinjiangensis]|uniref:Uncharacterized protein n=1 Tax=Kineococcus xinjiangensis TaxID=512762 RepID=A0A2S6IMB8_9ACTN|nr:hypothetical protein [Kineococcus xinjiangensis]PPK95402.1 hypothetical protein CLV92_106225 [Kineococcus xinjiangensis]
MDHHNGHRGDSGPAETAGEISEVIRPAAIVPEEAARAILVELALRDVQNGGVWRAQPSLWSRYDRPWNGPDNPAGAELIGRLHVAYGTPTKYEITVYRVTVTHFGSELGWSVESLADEALGHGDLRLQDCPRAVLASPPPPFRY